MKLAVSDWVLNCGGMINRSIYNLDDFAAVPWAYCSTYNKAPQLPPGQTEPALAMLQAGTTESEGEGGGEVELRVASCEL